MAIAYRTYYSSTLWAFVFFLCLPTHITPFVGSTRELVILSEYGEAEHIDITLNQDPRDPLQPAGIGAATNLLLNALYQGVPVLAPAPLWDVIVEHKKLFDTITQVKDIAHLYKLYCKYNRFSTKRELRVFQERCRHVKERYEKLTCALATISSPADIQKALLKEPIFDYSQAPLSIQHASEFTWYELSHYILCSAVPLDTYIMKEITLPWAPDLPFYLFIPKKYLQQARAEPTYGTAGHATISPDEIALGLKIDHFACVTDPFKPRTPNSRALANYPGAFLDILKALFVAKQEVSLSLTQRWTLYIMGHGTFSDEAHALMQKTQKELTRTKKDIEVAWKARDQKLNVSKQALRTLQARKNELEKANRVIGLSLDQFKQLLLFLEISLDTGLFWFSSCSAGGKQFVDAFSLDGQPAKLSYTVLADTLLEAPSMNASPVIRLKCEPKKSTKQKFSFKKLINWKKREIIVDTPYNFSLFFALARNKKSVTNGIHGLLRALNPVHQVKQGPNERDQKSYRLSAADINNITSIRMPQTHWFSAVDGIGSFLNLAMDPKTRIDVPRDKELILLSTPLISSPLHFSYGADEVPFPCFVSLIPGKAAHTIHEIHAAQYTFSSVIEAFFPCEKLFVPKLVHILKLTCIDDVSGTNNPAEFNNITLFNFVPSPFAPPGREYSNGITATLKEKTYVFSWPSDAPVARGLGSRLKMKGAAKSPLMHVGRFFHDANTLKDFVPGNNQVISVDDLSKKI